MLLHTVETDSGIGASQMRVDPVCEFYTDHPYPPAVENLDRARDEWRDENRLRAEYHLYWPNKPYRVDLDVLVAGCGTWQAAKYALCHPAARVLGIDVSPTSLDHTEKLKQKYKLTNLETRALSIENAEALERRFDLIVCTGVMHHLVNPDAGLGALRTGLKPEGALYLMVYAPYGRAGVYMLQDYCRRLGIGTSPAEIGDLAAVVAGLSPHHPLAIALRGARESLNTEALADALLNPRDRSYSVPQLFEFIDQNGLKFGRWYWQAPYTPQCGAISSTPHANRLAALSEREQSAAMELLRGTMTCHSAILYGSETKQFHFDDNEASRYVPIRLPWTVCVEERLPPGAAGVLLNQSHPFHDLILIIGAQQKRMFEAIDGRRTITEIADHARVDGLPRANAFFEKLWRYDQVVFSANSSKGKG